MPRQGTKIDAAVARILWWVLAALRLLMKAVMAGLAALVVGLMVAFIAWDVRNFQPQGRRSTS